MVYYRGMTLAGFGGVAGFFALFFFTDIPRVRKDIVQKIPFIGQYYVKEVPASDNVSHGFLWLIDLGDGVMWDTEGTGYAVLEVKRWDMRMGEEELRVLLHLSFPEQRKSGWCSWQMGSILANRANFFTAILKDERSIDSGVMEMGVFRRGASMTDKHTVQKNA